MTINGAHRGMFGANGSGDTSGYGRLVRRLPLLGSTSPPYGGYFDEVVDALVAALSEDGYAAAVERVVVYRDQLALEVRREHLPAVAQTLRDHRRCGSNYALACPGCTTPTTPTASCTPSTR